MTRTRSFLLSVAAAAVLLTAAPAHAVNKDLIQIQTQLQQLQDAVARLTQANDERMGVLKDLVQQTADSVNKMSVVVNGLQLKMQNQQDASAAKSDQLSGQVQALNDSLDELKARMARMQKAMDTIQSTQASMAATLANSVPAAGSGPAAAPTDPGTGSALPATATPPAATTPTKPGKQGRNVLPPAAVTPIPVDGPATVAATPAPDAPPVGDLYKTAYQDYMGGNYVPAAAEFQTLIQSYPDDNLAGNAYYYLGEIDLRTQKPTAAVKAYDKVLEHYPDNNKVPAAHLHKGDALISMSQRDAGIRELRALIQRFPNSPEAAQARSKLSSMGVASARK